MQFSSSPLRRINHLISELDAIYHEYALHFSMSDSQFAILYALCNEGTSCSLREVVKNSGVPKQTINSAMRKMEEEGLVFLENEGKRKKIVHLTQLGIKRCQESVVKLIEIENSILENWGKEKTERYLDETEEYNRLMKKGLADLCRSN